MSVSMSMFFLEPRFNKVHVGFKYAPKGLNYIISSVERLQLLRDPAVFTFSKIKQFPDIKISICSRMWAIQHGLEPCMLWFIRHLFQIVAPNMDQNEWFQVWFFKNFLGGAHQASTPDPSSVFFELRLRFGLRPQSSGALRLWLWLRPRFSGASRPRFGLRPQLLIGELGWFGPTKIKQ